VSSKRPFHEKQAELAAQSPLLANIFAASPLNRRGLMNEIDADEAAATKEATKDDAKEIRELEASGARVTAQLRRLEREGRGGVELDIFKQANALGLRREAAQLADPDLGPPEAA
jgi:hypothetical protein